MNYGIFVLGTVPCTGVLLRTLQVPHPDTDTATICYCLLLLLDATIARPYSYRCLCVPHGFAGEDSLAFGVGEMPG